MRIGEHSAVSVVEHIATSISTVRTLPELARAVEDVIDELAGVDFSAIYFVEQPGDQLRLFYAKGLSEQERAESERTAWERHPGRVIRTCLAYHEPDTRALPPGGVPVARSIEVRSRLYLPVMRRGECVGALGLAAARPHAFTEEHVQVLRFTGNLAAVVYQNVQDAAELERHRSNLQQIVADRTRELAEAKEAAEAASRTKGAFLANMSHEIRTPLNAVLGFAQVLQRDARLDPAQARHVQTILRSGEHLLRLINDVLDMSKIEAGRVVVETAVFPLHALVDELQAMFSSRAAAKGLRMLVERDASVPSHVVGDEAKLRQVLVNLIGNAVKFTEAGGVSVRLRLDQRDSPWLVAEVEDSGPGISADDQQRIFVAFQQAAGGARAGGTGLGLAISRRFVDLMGGQISVASTVGTGSCFRVDVPVVPAAAAVPPPEPAERPVVGLAPGAGPVRVLVVDDLQDNRDLLRALLEPVGLEVIEAADGAEALEVFQRSGPHAVLMDMRMPVMDGYEATRRLRATPAGRKALIIAVTASAFEDSRKQVMAAGVDAYVRKPFRPDEVFAALGAGLGLRYVVDEAPAGGGDTGAGISAVALPVELRQAMRRAVDEGDMGALLELAAQAEPVDAGAARLLRSLAERYEYARISDWLGVTPAP